MLVVNKKDHIGSYDCKGSKSSNEKSDLIFDEKKTEICSEWSGF